MNLLVLISISCIQLVLLSTKPSPLGASSGEQQIKSTRLSWGPFNRSHYDIFDVESSATINNGALQITPDSMNDAFVRQNKSGRVLHKEPFRLWQDGEGNSSSSNVTIASFDTSFLINIYRSPKTTAAEGFAFIIAPNLNGPPLGSEGQFLGLTNSTTDSNSTNHLIAIELDTFKDDFDPDDNHLGLDINSIRSTKTVSLSPHGIQIAPVDAKNYTVWINYDGPTQMLKVYMAQEGLPIPTNKPPLLNEKLNLRDYVLQDSYLGFSASTGNSAQLNCVLAWNITVEILPKSNRGKKKKKILLLGVGLPLVLLLLLLGVGGLMYYLRKRRRRNVNDSRIMGALKSLPGMPREFRYKDLKKATNNFDEKLKLGQGGFGVVYKGVLNDQEQKLEVAVKKFSRDSIKGKDDFLAELTIINRLRHKHLVRLVGWCHQNGMLLLVYDFMPNGSLDNHLFNDQEQEETLSWDRRYNIISGVASALQYLHNEYDQKVVHRDLKASNIMLDSDYNARLGDFGLARALENGMTSYAELEVEGVPGTMGYIAPECFHTGKATRESDVFGFGAVILEVVCCQRPWTKIAGSQFLVDWVWTSHRKGQILEAVDKRLGNKYIDVEAQRLLLLGLACSHPIASERPKTQSIVQIISGSVPVPNVPPFRPAFVWPMMGGLAGDSSMTNDTSQDTTPMTSSYYDYGGSGSGRTPHRAMSDAANFHWSQSYD